MIKEAISTTIALAALVAVNTSTANDEAPALWVARDADSTIYLFGTFHMVPNDLEWRTASFENAMADATVTYLEADSQTTEGQSQIQAAIGRTGMNPAGVTLTEQLGPERAAAFAGLANQFGLPMEQLERLRPWLAVVAVTQRIYAQLGLDVTGIDARVYAQATQEGDDVRYLENAATQIGALSTLGGEEMLRHVDQGIENIAELEQYTADLLAAWRSGDEAALETLVIAQMRAETPSLFQSIFVDRNAAWADQIADLMAGEGRYFIAVGAGHLVGEGSVIAMLREQGIAIERLQ